MLPEQKLAVLYTDNFMSDEYHIMLSGGEIVRCVLKADRKAMPDSYGIVYWWLRKLGINRLWVHPDNMLSTWVMRSDFNQIERTPDNGILHWSSPEKTEDNHPKGIRMFVMGDVTRWIFFPEHMHLVRNERIHQVSRKIGNWLTPSPDHLYNSVEYLERATDYPLLWSPAYSSKMILRNLHKGKKIVPFMENDTFQNAYRKMVIRPTWIYRRRNGQRGIPEIWCLARVIKPVYIHGLDKNMQYLGACVSNTLPNEKTCQRAPGNLFDKRSVGIWEYEILDVGNSMFNSYDLPCPLDMKRTWASTSVINFAIDSGIKLHIEQGLIFDREKAGRYLDKWAHLLWDVRKQLEDTHKYPDSIAAKNASDSTKKYYIDMIGQFCAEYSDEYHHREWNTMIVHEAIARQGYTLLTRPELHGNVFLVVNDSFYVLSHEPDVYKAFPSLLKYEHDLRGYKHVGTCQLSQAIEDMCVDRNVSPVDVEMCIKGQMVKYASIR
jgi:hypothetical protein